MIHLVSFDTFFTVSTSQHVLHQTFGTLRPEIHETNEEIELTAHSMYYFKAQPYQLTSHC